MADAFEADLDDLFSYEPPAPPTPLEGPPGGGLRFVALARVVGIELVRFKIDISSSDALVGGLEWHRSDPVLAAVGYPRSLFPVYPVAQSIAEKIHAVTLPRDYENSRVRDLVDLVWFAERFTVRSDELIDAAVATFTVRADHPWPPSLPTPPASWAKPYARLQTEVGLVPATPDDAIATLAPFLVPVLAGERGLAWNPSIAAWHTVDRPSG